MHTQAWDLINKSHYITLISHINPDADTLGSMLSFYPILKKMGKNVSLFNATKEIARKYDFLPNFKKIKNSFPAKCDLLISFDCGSFDRLGVPQGDFKIINVDHHHSNTHYGDINIIETAAASATLVTKHLLEHTHTLSQDEAICIYTGLVEDTGFFTFQNSNETAFLEASKLITIGVNPAEIAQNLKMRNSLAKTRLTALFINSIELLKDAGVAVGTVLQEDLKKSGALKNECDHLVDILRNLSTVSLAIFILQEKDGSFKVSLRSKSDLDVSQIALAFGGGGHKRAAGFESEMIEREELIQNILTKAQNG